VNWPADKGGQPERASPFRPRLPGRRLLLMLLLVLLFGTSGDNPLTQVERIQARGTLVMLTVNGATTYFLGPQGETGYEYDLARAFSDHVGVPLEVVTLPTINDLVDAVQHGYGDFVAANLSRTAMRQSDLRFGPAYESISPVVVYRRGNRRPESLDDLKRGRLGILEGTSYELILNRAVPDLDWQIVEDASIEDLFELISSEEIDYTIVDSNILELNRRFFPDVRPAFEIDQAQQLAWATRRSDDDSLVQKMREFFVASQNNGLMADLRQRHYDHVESYEPVGTYTFQRQIRERLPPLRGAFEH